jgi:hypothetical protein
MRLCGSPEQVNAQLDEAMQLDPVGGYGQLAKAMKAAQTGVPEQPGAAQQVIQGSPAAVAQAIRGRIPASQEFRVIRENLVLLAKGSRFASLYLLRPQPDGTTLLRLIVHQTALVEAAVLSPDLKTGLANLMALPGLKQAAPAAVTEHLQAIAEAVQPTSPPTGTQPGATSPADPFAALARKPLPTTTAATSQPFRPGTLSPAWYASMAFLFGGIFMTPFLAYKWRGLGKPTWMWWTLAAAILTLIVTVGAAVSLWHLVPQGPGQYVLAALLLGTNYGFVFALASLQNGAYQKVRQEGPEALAGYSYNFTRAGLIGGGFIAGSIVLGIVLYVARPMPVRFDHKYVRLTYPADWKTDDVTKSTQCKTSECFVYLYQGRFGSTAMVIGRFWLDDAMSPADAEHLTWTNISRQSPGVKLDSRDTVQVGGVSAARRFFFFPTSTSQDLSYAMQIYVTQGRAAYFISVWSVNKPIFDEDRSAVDEIVASLVWKIVPLGNPG